MSAKGQKSRSRSKLAVHVRILYLAIPAIAVAISLIVGSIIARGAFEDTAKQLTRQYSIEAAANFQISTYQHFVLMQQIAYSTTIARWLANEGDLELKSTAFEEIMGFANFSPDTRLMFTVYGTLQSYDFHTGLTLEDFVSWGQLAGGEVSQWFFDTRDAERPFILNIQRERPELTEELIVLFMWSNHRVYYLGQFVGVVTVGSPFEYVFDALFGDFETGYKRGYIIDGDGAVRADSAGLLTVAELGIPTLPYLPEAAENQILADSIKEHIQRMVGGVFPQGLFSYTVIPLSSGSYSFAGIAPIVGTDWSVVVLSANANFFANLFSGAGRNYMPLIAAVVAAVLLSALVGNLFIRQIALVPRESEREAFELTQRILDSAPFVINLWDDSVNLISTNHQAVELHGLESEEQYIKEFFNLSPEYQPDGMLSNEKAMGYLDTAYKRGWVTFEWMHSRLDGTLIPTKINIVRTTHKDKTILLGYTTDLSQVKEAEDLTRNLLDNAPLFMEFWDENGNMTDCNQKMVEFFGVNDKADFTQRFYEFSAPIQPCGTPAHEMNISLINTAMEKGSCRGEWTYLLPNGEELPAEATWVRITHRNKPMVVVYSHDLRPLKEAEKQRLEAMEEINKTKSRFLAMMSHEIRTPITAVLGISEIQLRSQDIPSHIDMPPHIIESFAQIHDSANILLGIVNDILDFSKIESGNMSLVEKEYEIASLVNNAVRIRFLNRDHKNIEFILNVGENLPTTLIGDELRIRQVMNNLLSNAFKYTNKGSINLSMDREPSGKDGYVNIIISIEDTGFGMTPKQLEMLKNHDSEYKRFHEHREHTVAGTGLGIPIVHNLMEMMDAGIEFKSEVGSGTLVVVRIPQKIPQGKEGITLGKEMAQSLQNFEKGTWSDKQLKFVPELMPYGNVLVVDDVEANLYVAQGLLSFYELNVETVTNGQAAIDRIEEKSKKGQVYDLVLMDETMPGLSGVETMQILRNMDYNHPIVALTANAIVGQAEEFIKSGFDDFVSKPINSEHLHTVLIKFVRDRQQPEPGPELESLSEKTQKPRGNLSVTHEMDDFQNSPDTLKVLRSMFLDTQKNTAVNIRHALEGKDTKTAHRLAHTLKSSANLIHESQLAQFAEQAELSLAQGDIPKPELLVKLEKELSRVLEGIGPDTGRAH